MTANGIPDTLASTRDALHQLAYFALSPARYLFEERMGLKPTRRGFGTPAVGGRVLRVEDDQLVAETAEGVATRTITTVGDAADFFGVTYRRDWFEGGFGDPLEPYPPDAALDIDVASVRLIGDLFAQGERVLRQFGEAVGEITEIQLWPEHFDLATETGDEEAGRRASYGVSPGDAAHPLPYFYVSAWGEIGRSDPYWNDAAFNGASLGYTDLLRLAHPETTAMEFLVEGYRAIHAD